MTEAMNHVGFTVLDYVNSLDGVGFFVKLFVNGICYLGVGIYGKGLSKQ